MVQILIYYLSAWIYHNITLYESIIRDTYFYPYHFQWYMLNRTRPMKQFFNISSNSETNASELLENIEGMFPSTDNNNNKYVYSAFL